MRLRFIGTNGSLGLVFGRVYRLEIHPWNDGIRISAPVNCPYVSEEAFWLNWALPDVDVRDVFEKIGRNLREEHVGEPVKQESVRQVSCSKIEIHGSHNWVYSEANSIVAWCPGKTIPPANVRACARQGQHSSHRWGALFQTLCPGRLI